MCLFWDWCSTSCTSFDKYCQLSYLKMEILRASTLPKVSQGLTRGARGHFGGLAPEPPFNCTILIIMGGQPWNPLELFPLRKARRSFCMDRLAVGILRGVFAHLININEHLICARHCTGLLRDITVNKTGKHPRSCGAYFPVCMCVGTGQINNKSQMVRFIRRIGGRPPAFFL